MNKWIVNSPDEKLLPFVKKMGGEGYSLKDLRWAIEHHRCKVNGIIERFCSRRLKAGDRIEISLLKRPKVEFDSSRALFEDDFFLIYDKPAQITSEDLAKKFTLHLIHRLDRDTTGSFLLAKTPQSQLALEDLFRKREIQKTYLAIIKGHPKSKRGTIENYIGKLGEKEGEGIWGVVNEKRGKWAKTEWETLTSLDKSTFVRCFTFTGRTHQIRVHLSSIGHPIIGDCRYGDRTSNAFRPLLHAELLKFLHPFTKEEIVVSSPLPEDFSPFLESHEEKPKISTMFHSCKK